MPRKCKPSRIKGECARSTCHHLTVRHDKRGRCEVPGCNCLQFVCGFTTRQFQILMLFAQGMNAKAIARKLQLSHKTIESHKHNMLHKSGTRSAIEMVLTSIRKGLISMEDLPDNCREFIIEESKV